MTLENESIRQKTCTYPISSSINDPSQGSIHQKTFFLNNRPQQMGAYIRKHRVSSINDPSQWEHASENSHSPLISDPSKCEHTSGNMYFLQHTNPANGSTHQQTYLFLNKRPPASVFFLQKHTCSSMKDPSKWEHASENIHVP